MKEQGTRPFNLNAPRWITFFLVGAFLLLGLSGTLAPIESLNRLLADSGYPLTREWGYFFLAAAPLLLMLGATLRDI